MKQGGTAASLGTRYAIDAIALNALYDPEVEDVMRALTGDAKGLDSEAQAWVNNASRTNNNTALAVRLVMRVFWCDVHMTLLAEARAI